MTDNLEHGCNIRVKLRRYREVGCADVEGRLGFKVFRKSQQNVLKKSSDTHLSKPRFKRQHSMPRLRRRSALPRLPTLYQPPTRSWRMS